MLTTKAGGNVRFPRVGKLLTLAGYQTEPTVDIACAAILSPGDAKAAAPTDLNAHHNSHGHAHELLFRNTAKQQGVQLTEGPLLPCLGCSMAKGQVKPVKKSSDNRAVKKLCRIFLDLGGKMQSKSIGGSSYTSSSMIAPVGRVFFSSGTRLKPPKSLRSSWRTTGCRGCRVKYISHVPTAVASFRETLQRFAAGTASSKSSPPPTLQSTTA